MNMSQQIFVCVCSLPSRHVTFILSTTGFKLVCHRVSASMSRIPPPAVDQILDFCLFQPCWRNRNVECRLTYGTLCCGSYFLTDAGQMHLSVICFLLWCWKWTIKLYLCVLCGSSLLFLFFSFFFPWGRGDENRICTRWTWWGWWFAECFTTRRVDMVELVWRSPVVPNDPRGLGIDERENIVFPASLARGIIKRSENCLDPEICSGCRPNTVLLFSTW